MPLPSKTVPRCYTVVEITIHRFPHYIPPDGEVKQLRKQSSGSDESFAWSEGRLSQGGLSLSWARVLAVFPHSGLGASLPPCPRLQGCLAEQGGAPLPPLAQRGREQAQATERSRIRDRLQPRTVPTGGFQEKEASDWEYELWDALGGWAKLMRGC